ncbi:MAG: hypothetical protein IPP46_18500 [Bacteroidetes bacterium]|nr:hypothetical protein [Bacteroidota bacterium]
MRNLAKQNLIGIITLLIINFSLITLKWSNCQLGLKFMAIVVTISVISASDSVSVSIFGRFIGQLIIGNDTLISHNLTSLRSSLTKADNLTSNDILGILLPTTYNYWYKFKAVNQSKLVLMVTYL